MEQKIVYLNQTPFKVETANKKMHRLDMPGYILGIEDLKDEGSYFSLLLDAASGNAISSLTEIDNNNNVRVVVPKQIFEDNFWTNERWINQLNNISSENGWNLWVAEQALSMRLSGRLNTVEISGHTFYVDIPMDKLRPKDDFSSNGIPFKSIENYLSDDAKNYRISYDPISHEFRDIDLSTITAIPEDLIVVEFPYERELDPLGYSRKHGIPFTHLVREIPFKADFIAQTIPWKETGIDEAIKINQSQAKQIAPKIKAGKRIKRG